MSTPDNEPVEVESLALHDQVVAGALALLDPQQRHVLMLSYFDHYTQRQIAETLAISNHAVGRAAAKGLQALARHLEGVQPLRHLPQPGRPIGSVGDPTISVPG